MSEYRYQVDVVDNENSATFPYAVAQYLGDKRVDILNRYNLRPHAEEVVLGLQQGTLTEDGVRGIESGSWEDMPKADWLEETADEKFGPMTDDMLYTLEAIERDKTHVFIVGKGWIKKDSVTCTICGDEGFIVSKWGDCGDAENGPKACAEEGHYCTCIKGVESLREQESWTGPDNPHEEKAINQFVARQVLYPTADTYDARLDGTMEEYLATQQVRWCVWDCWSKCIDAASSNWTDESYATDYIQDLYEDRESRYFGQNRDKLSIQDEADAEVRDGHSDGLIAKDEEYDDPPCCCGVYRSEHSMLGCGNFQSPESWRTESEFITSLDDDEYERIYGRD